jgi:YD repeat-containing protein
MPAAGPLPAPRPPPPTRSRTGAPRLPPRRPRALEDANGLLTEVRTDPLGRVTAAIVHLGADGDPDLDDPTTRFTYTTDTVPNAVRIEAREAHGGTPAWLDRRVYLDGGGQVVQTKDRVAPGPAPARDATGDLLSDGDELQWAEANPRWVGSGRVVVDNKGAVVKHHEPFFSDTPDFDDEAELAAWGVTPVLEYDPVGRNTQVTLPDGALRRFVYSPWEVQAWDEEDTEPTSPHADTPALSHLDAMGRPVETRDLLDADWLSHRDGPPGDRVDPLASPGVLRRRVTLDVSGHPVQITDPRGVLPQVQTFDLLGRPLFTGAADEGHGATAGAGETRVAPDAAGSPLRVWRSGGLTLRHTHDALRRPIGLFVDEGAGERLVTRSFYGEALSDAPAHSRGRPVRVYDTAGELRLAHDFRGRVATQTREVLADVTAEADWSDLDAATSLAGIDAALATLGALSGEGFAVETAHDALDRVTEQTAPDGSRTVPGYDAGGRLITVDVHVRGASPATAFIGAIAYNARGQRTEVVYGNHTSTTFTYDPQRFWLARLVTARSAASSHGAATLQDLAYSRDRVGNVTGIVDGAQETVYFANAQVSPDRSFTYDALYRLIRATGREKVGQAQTTAFYAGYAGAMGAIPDSGDPALRAYTQSYTFDASGNLTEMKHQQGTSGPVLWRRGCAIAAGSNQLVSSSVPGDDPDDPSTHSDVYAYDARGALIFLPHLVDWSASST